MIDVSLDVLNYFFHRKMHMKMGSRILIKIFTITNLTLSNINSEQTKFSPEQRIFSTIKSVQQKFDLLGKFIYILRNSALYLNEHIQNKIFLIKDHVLYSNHCNGSFSETCSTMYFDEFSRMLKPMRCSAQFAILPHYDGGNSIGPRYLTLNNFIFRASF